MYHLLSVSSAMLISFLRGTRAYCDGKRVLFECSDAFRDYIRNNREVSKRLKETIYRVSRTKYSIGPYEEPLPSAWMRPCTRCRRLVSI